MNSEGEEPGRILVVEDERHIARFLEYVLQKAGYEVDIAEDGRQALEILADFRPHAMILDLVLPEISGLDLLKTIRKEAAYGDLVVVVVSAHWFGEDDQQLREAGATAQCSKPIAPSTLLGKLLELGIKPQMPLGSVA
ncbi:MAG TPA: response regulator [Bryobacteraceae bacterium]|nr:response regulator [Bryobacteraceae bacterium]